MTSLTDRTITALREVHDDLAALALSLTEAQLTGPSGASDWSVAQVLSHLGSGSEIALATYQAAFSGGPEPAGDFNQAVWDRWDAMTPKDQATNFVGHGAALVESIEALTPEQRENLQITFSYLPFPLGISTLAGMRLNEVALHGWDVQVAIDPGATLNETSAGILAEQYAGGMGFMLGFIGKADALAEPAVVDVRGSGYGYLLVIADAVSLSPTEAAAAADADADADATATYTGPLEGVIRLIGGRLTPTHTPGTVSVAGNVSLDDLRRVFPGY